MNPSHLCNIFGSHPLVNVRGHRVNAAWKAPREIEYYKADTKQHENHQYETPDYVLVYLQTAPLINVLLCRAIKILHNLDINRLECQSRLDSRSYE